MAVLVLRGRHYLRVVALRIRTLAIRSEVGHYPGPPGTPSLRVSVRGDRSPVYQRRVRYSRFIPLHPATTVSAQGKSNGFIHDEVNFTTEYKTELPNEEQFDWNLVRDRCPGGENKLDGN